MIEQIEWVACSERLPDTRRLVLICDGHGYVSAGWYGVEFDEAPCWHDEEGGEMIGIRFYAEMPAGPRG